MHGLGVFTWNDGKRYEGDFVNDLKQGYGELIWANGRIYKGNWLNNK